MTTAQWAGISKRTPTYLKGYRDAPGSQDRAQRRAEWLASLPLWNGMASVLEVGCGAGRNLACLSRRRPELRVLGADICPEAVGEARRILPGGQVGLLDLYEVPEWPDTFVADAVLTCGVLCHLEPSVLPGVLRALAVRARRRLVLVEHFDARKGGVCLKGPKPWRPELRDTGAYMLWTLHRGRIFGSLWQHLERVGWSPQTIEIPRDLQAPGATEVLVLSA